MVLICRTVVNEADYWWNEKGSNILKASDEAVCSPSLMCPYNIRY